MLSRVSTAAEAVKEPEYTGANRCLPCTVVNVILAVVVAGVLGVVFVPLGVITLIISLALIYLRGYLVPGTPTLTKRYLPDSVLAQFDKAPDHRTVEPSTTESAAGGGDEYELEMAKKIEYEKANRVDPSEFLSEIGAIRTGSDDEWELTTEFETRIKAAGEDLEESDLGADHLVELFDVAPDDVEPKEREYPAFNVSGWVRKWPAEGALLTDIASDRALKQLDDEWMAVPTEQRLDILESLRLLNGSCPACEGAVQIGEETVESCCRLYPVVRLECVECGLQITELDPDELDSGSVSWELSGDPGVVKRI